MFAKVLKLYSIFLDKSFYEYYDLQNEKIEELRPKNKPIKFKIKGYGCSRFYNETSYEDYDDEDYKNENYDNSYEFIDIPDMSPLESDEEVKKGKN